MSFHVVSVAINIESQTSSRAGLSLKFSLANQAFLHVHVLKSIREVQMLPGSNQ